MSEPTTSGGGNKGKAVIIILFIILLVGINAYQYYFRNQEGKRYEQIITNKDDEISKYLGELDSLQAELQLKSDEIERLGGDNAALESKIAELQEERDKFKRSSNIAWGKVNRLKRAKEEYFVLANQAEEELTKLKAIQDSLNAYNNELKAKIDTQNTQMNTMQTDLEKKEELLEIARKLKVKDFRILAVQNPGEDNQKERDKQPFKDKHLEALYIGFLIEPNQVAVIENKEIFIQVQDPSGTTIYDLEAGSGTFEIDEEEMYYTVKKDVLYDRSEAGLEVFFKKGSPYESGRYIINVFAENVQIGTSSFEVK